MSLTVIRMKIKPDYPPRLISVVMVDGVFWEFTALVPILKIVPTHIHSKRHLVREGMIVEGDRETEFRAIWRRVVTGRKASWRERNRCRKLAGRRRIACKHHAAKENVSPNRLNLLGEGVVLYYFGAYQLRWCQVNVRLIRIYDWM